MKKVILFLTFFFMLNTAIPTFINSKENLKTTTKQCLEEYIYVRVIVDNKIFVYVYLSDGITLVNVYEEED